MVENCKRNMNSDAKSGSGTGTGSAAATGKKAVHVKVRMKFENNTFEYNFNFMCCGHWRSGVLIDIEASDIPFLFISVIEVFLYSFVDST